MCPGGKNLAFLEEAYFTHFLPIERKLWELVGHNLLDLEGPRRRLEQEIQGQGPVSHLEGLVGTTWLCAGSVFDSAFS